MSKMQDGNLILTPNEFRELLNNLRNPNKAALEKRDAFLKSIDNMNITDQKDGTVLINLEDNYEKNKV